MNECLTTLAIGCETEARKKIDIYRTVVDFDCLLLLLFIFVCFFNTSTRAIAAVVATTTTIIYMCVCVCVCVCVFTNLTTSIINKPT